MLFRGGGGGTATPENVICGMRHFDCFFTTVFNFLLSGGCTCLNPPPGSTLEHNMASEA